MKKKHLLLSCGLYLPCVCSLLNRVRVCQILLSLGWSWFFVSFLSLLLPHLLTSIGDAAISPICIIGSPALFIVSYMPSLGSSYYAFKSDGVTETPMDCGTMAMCIVHIAYVALNFEVQQILSSSMLNIHFCTLLESDCL